MQRLEIVGQRRRVLPRELLHDLARGDRILARVVGVAEFDPIVLRHRDERALALAEAVELLVDDERVKHRRDRRARNAVAPLLGRKQRQVVRRVVDDQWEAALNELRDAFGDLGDADGGIDAA